MIESKLQFLAFSLDSIMSLPRQAFYVVSALHHCLLFRQGCPLSGILFVIGIEILALAIKKNTKIEGIRVGAREIKITQCAAAEAYNKLLADVTESNTYRAFLPFDTPPIRKIGFCPERDSNPRLPDY